MIYGPSSQRIIQVFEDLSHRLKDDITHAERELLEKAHVLAIELVALLRKLHHGKFTGRYKPNGDKEIQNADQKGSRSKDQQGQRAEGDA